MKIKCSIESCNNLVKCKNFCQKHYIRYLKYGDPLHIKRAEKGSDQVKNKNRFKYITDFAHENANKYGKVSEHYYVMSKFLNRKIKDNEYIIHIDGDYSNNNIENLKLEESFDICIVNGCNDITKGKIYCEKHYIRNKKYGDPNIILVKRDPNNPGHLDKYGYIIMRHPITKKPIRQHRLIMEIFLKRELYKHENVHHINGDRSDNRIENLELWSKCQPCGQRVIDKINWAKEILKQYKDYEENYKEIN